MGQRKIRVSRYTFTQYRLPPDWKVLIIRPTYKSSQK